MLVMGLSEWADMLIESLGQGIKKPEPGEFGCIWRKMNNIAYLILCSLRTPERTAFHTFSGMKKEVEEIVVFSRFIILF
jgi:hypothetical protein